MSNNPIVQQIHNTPQKKLTNSQYSTFSGSSGQDGINDNDSFVNFPASEWLSKAMHKHSDILELRERTRPITNSKSYSRNKRAGKTEASHAINDTILLKMVMQYLHEENLTTSLKKIQEETKLQFVPNEVDKDTLENLLRIGIKDINWFGPLANNEDPDCEVETYHAYNSDDSNENNLEEGNLADDRYDESQIIRNPDMTIQAASLNRLLLWLVGNFNGQDANEKKIFFLTYPSFTSAETILNKFIQIYHSFENIDSAQVICFIKVWIEQQPTDFNEKLLAILNNFIDHQVATAHAKQLRAVISSKIEKKETQRREIKDPPEPKVPKNIFSPTLTFDDIDEEEIARQLCVIDFGLYELIKTSEFLIKGWTKPQFRSKAVNLLNMMRRFNDFTKWIASSILNEQNSKGRTKLLGRFLKISEHLRANNNFHSLMAIYGGINNTHVFRTKAIRKDLSKQQQETFADLEKLFSSENSFRNYRINYKDAKPPCIPFLGIHLRDLAFVDESNPDRINNLINLNKRRIIWKVITNTMRYQPMAYNFLKVHQISLFLTELKIDVEQTQPLDFSPDTVLPNSTTKQ
ncbi:Ras guanine nucleotide exchange factor [Dictyostelium purpureum]|uniref:Ras guanine nucleotide exchange factor n=1 Tax=Dictyostelium purpureum TaxID=5786 RepID=F1A281_DICPU|nr:Ras guanine nucleotide exchange factor [Dictyostelium purpureum]EGC29698.1 Ras guanine nucleotide exchange factor [Dictyostelium purpureum]|eukprot:XP_003293780.1 Ras guanine nucleotide exchange factor [Dictyostelium purpureum]